MTLLVVVVVFQNTETIETRILFATVAMSHALLLGVTFLAGAAVGFLGALWIARARHRRKARASGG